MAEVNDFRKELEDIAKTDIFEVANDQENFVGNPFKIDYDRTSILTCDDWKYNVGGIAQGCFLLAFYENDFGDDEVHEALLIRAIRPCPIPSDSSVISSRIEYFKEELKTAGKNRQIDQFTRFEFSCSGLECSILGTFYKDKDGVIEFGADLENFYSPHLYKVYKPSGKYLKYIVNLRDSDGPLKPESNFQIGNVRYSSSRKNYDVDVNSQESVLMHTKDILGKRTALFGMTRTGKSNTVKKLIEATEELSQKSNQQSDQRSTNFEDNLSPYYENEVPKDEVGQIIFDINGEYANKNLQDGTAIFEKYDKKVTRYSVLEKDNFEVLKINFYRDVVAGQELMRGYFKQLGKQSDYVEDFLGVSLEDSGDLVGGDKIRYNRKIAAYKCCLKLAGFPVSGPDKLYFDGCAELNTQVKTGGIDPKKGVSYDDAITWFSQVWKHYEEWDYLKNYETNRGKPWADNDLKAALRFLTQYRRPRERGPVNSYIKLRSLIKYHTTSATELFEDNICKLVREGKIVIVDLSQGDPEIQNLYSEKICRAIFNSSMKNFIDAKPNNFIQFYFEEAHNLFPKKDDKDLSQIYNRIAKEGAKLNLGMVYATQEVSSISSNILKNTQNWFIAHLNNEDEVKELRKFYDFRDFADALIRFSAKNDKGFVRMKTYSNPFVVPIQVKLFT
ncbi:MAG: ATP-binding protein [Flavobacteriales bacterium]|nr:ATP-binding protein [Flavobacteriales bacterium]